MANFHDLIEAFTYSFTELAQKIPSAVKDAVTNVLFDTTTSGGTTTQTVSNLGLFCFLMLGVTLVIGVTRWAVSLVRRKI